MMRERQIFVSSLKSCIQWGLCTLLVFERLCGVNGNPAGCERRTMSRGLHDGLASLTLESRETHEYSDVQRGE